MKKDPETAILNWFRRKYSIENLLELNPLTVKKFFKEYTGKDEYLWEELYLTFFLENYMLICNKFESLFPNRSFVKNGRAA